MSLLSRYQAWCARRRQDRLWPTARMVERLRVNLISDGRWLASDPVASALIERYQLMIAPAWFRIPLEDIITLRRRLGLDPHAKRSEPSPAGTLTREQIDEMTLDSTRLHWLTEDHHDPLTRARRNEILVRIRVISHSAAVAAIDGAIHEAMEREALAARTASSAP